MKERYKTIKNYPNYEVSSEGRVRNAKTGRILRLGWDKNGYQHVDLYKDRKHKHHLIHRLVADAFIPNPENKRTVNHINGIKTDNRVENLEWNTNSENLKHAYKNELKKQSNKNPFKANNPKPKQRVRCIETGQEFESMSSAARYFGCIKGNIHHSIHKGYKVHKKYHFELV